MPLDSLNTGFGMLTGPGIPGQMALGVGVWFPTLVWDLRGWPGPVERVHRRLAYGRSALP
ncbi:hypothetical protein NYP18_05555 [Corynebacterium sp. YIM 101645]|uniref:Uncharacterized protein n=1 Tax=Corynebacterium lemuris TaxID=1859292 RepID=A0ABT2FV44_9CORY|nr:hypothetical protein [Corynebacterium lemuris]MCS5479115.1 hypothetical protein [Corynebacterium lemuris]